MEDVKKTIAMLSIYCMTDKVQTAHQTSVLLGSRNLLKIALLYTMRHTAKSELDSMCKLINLSYKNALL